MLTPFGNDVTIEGSQLSVEMPNQDNLTRGRLPSGRSPFNIRLPDSLWTDVNRIAQSQEWSRSYCIEMLVRRSLNKYQIDGYNVEDLDRIFTGNSNGES